MKIRHIMQILLIMPIRRRIQLVLLTFLLMFMIFKTISLPNLINIMVTIVLMSAIGLIFSMYTEENKNSTKES